jgi:hypothetical protein
MTKDSSRKKAIRVLMGLLKMPYMQAATVYDGRACVFCRALLEQDEDDNYLEEVGEILPRQVNDDYANIPSVLAHPDCTPRGWDVIQQGQDPEWAMA